MKKQFLIIVFLIVSFKGYSQTVSCEDLLDFIKSKGS